MAEVITVLRNQIEITGNRTMNLYTFELDGRQMPEMSREDVVETVHPDTSSVQAS